MKTVILCGGRGTRLREETEYRPKPLVPIGGKPILWHIMKTYAAQGHRDFILCLGYKGGMIKEFFRNYLWNLSDVTLRLGHRAEVQFHDHHDEEDWTVTLVETGLETGTAGRIAQVERFLAPGEPFFLTYGDGVGDIDVNAAAAYHRDHGRVLTLTAVRPPGRFGELKMDGGGRIADFTEKPQAESGFINGGFLVASPSLFGYLRGPGEEMLEREPMNALARDGELMAYRHDGFWQPMDNFAEYTLLNRLWEAGEAPWKIWD